VSLLSRYGTWIGFLFGFWLFVTCDWRL
jgi:hypothetical protein